MVALGPSKRWYELKMTDFEMPWPGRKYAFDSSLGGLLDEELDGILDKPGGGDIWVSRYELLFQDGALYCAE